MENCERSKHGTDQIAMLRIIVEQSIEWQYYLYINFRDFEKVFDSISREVLWRLLPLRDARQKS